MKVLPKFLFHASAIIASTAVGVDSIERPQTGLELYEANSISYDRRHHLRGRVTSPSTNVSPSTIYRQMQLNSGDSQCDLVIYENGVAYRIVMADGLCDGASSGYGTRFEINEGDFSKFGIPTVSPTSFPTLSPTQTIGQPVSPNSIPSAPTIDNSVPTIRPDSGNVVTISPNQTSSQAPSSLSTSSPTLLPPSRLVVFSSDRKRFAEGHFMSKSFVVDFHQLMQTKMYTRIKKLSPIQGDNENDLSRWRLSLSYDGATVAVGGYRHVTVFHEVSQGSWISDVVSGDEENDWFGHQLSLSRDASILAVGSPGDHTSSKPGYVKLFNIEVRANGEMNLVQIGNDLIGHRDGDRFGFRVSLSGDALHLGVSGFQNTFVRVYRISESELVQIGSDIPACVETAEISFSDDGKVFFVENGRNGIHCDGVMEMATGATDLEEFPLYPTNPPSNAPTISPTLPSNPPSNSPTISPTPSPLNPPTLTIVLICGGIVIVFLAIAVFEFHRRNKDARSPTYHQISSPFPITNRVIPGAKIEGHVFVSARQDYIDHRHSHQSSINSKNSTSIRGSRFNTSINKKHVFLSARFLGDETEVKARQLCQELQNLDVNIFIAEAGAGEAFGPQINHGLCNMVALLAICSSNYGEKTESSFSSHTELKHAHQHNIPILPVKLCTQWPPHPKEDHDGGNEGWEQNQVVFRRDLLYQEWGDREWDAAECAKEIKVSLKRIGKCPLINYTDVDGGINSGSGDNTENSGHSHQNSGNSNDSGNAGGTTTSIRRVTLQKQKHVFLSARFLNDETEKKGRELCQELKNQGIIMFIAEAGAGEAFGPQVNYGLCNMVAFLAICSSNYGEKTSSIYSSHYELKHAHQNHVPIIPLKLCTEWPPHPKEDYGGGGRNEGWEQNQVVFRKDLHHCEWSDKDWDVVECAKEIKACLEKMGKCPLIKVPKLDLLPDDESHADTSSVDVM